MIKFEFTLSDEDAQNFIELFNDKISECKLRIMSHKEDGHLTLVEAYEDSLCYFNEMKRTVLNGQKRIE